MTKTLPLNQLTLKKAKKLIDQNQTSAAEITQAVWTEIDRLNPKLNIYLTLNQSAKKDSQSKTQKLLAGLPLAIKDNILTQGLRTTASSLVLDNFIPPYNATLINRLNQAGGVIVGKTNLDAWAHGSSTETSQFGRTLNPRNPDYLPGGSSGGSAAAVAADLCLAAIGTETAGSIRQPAAWCGVVGLKPTYGRVSRYGVIAMASSTDSPGPITKTVADSAYLLNILAGHDQKDGTTTDQTMPDLTKSLDKSIKGLKIGLLYQDIDGMSVVKPHIKKAADVLSDLGADVQTTTAIDPHYAISVYTIVQRSEVSSNLARYDGVRFGHGRDQFGDEAKRRIMLGAYTLSKGYADQYYQTAQKVRTLFLEDFQKLFTRFDVLISATSPSFAKPINASQDQAMFGELEDMLMEPTSITGFPGINVPCFRDEKTNLFLGLNIMAPMWREDLVVQVADAYEKATDWNTWRQHE